MDDNEVVELDLQLDSADAEKTLERLLEDADALGEIFKSISAEMSKLFGVLQKSLEKTTANVELMTQALGKATEAMEKLVQGFSAEGLAAAGEQALGILGDIMGGIASAFAEMATAEWGTTLLNGLSEVAKRLFGIIDDVLKINGEIAAVIAIIAVTLATIVAVVANWDKISSAMQTFVTETLPQAWSQVTQLFQSIAAVITPVVNEVQGLLQVCLDDIAGGFSQMLEAMRPLAEFVGNVFLTVFELLRQVFTDTRIFAVAEGSALGDLLQAIADFATQLWEQLRLALANIRSAMETEGTSLGNLFRIIGDAVANLWKCVGPILEGLWLIFDETFQSVGRTVGDIVGFILGAVSGLVTMLSGIFTGDWSVIWEGMGQVCKNAVNGIIGVLNLLLSGLTGALNGVFKLLNKVSVEVPDWVPGMGGKTFGFSLKTVTAPQIPYLAKGAVLPANQPFLAVVGDQKHGTNVEAPLATIQEAVALTLEDLTQSNLAGHQATVAVLRQILEAVLGIHIGDGELYRAVERYREKRAVMHGTGW